MNEPSSHLGNWDTLVMVLALSAGIMATRFLPFLLFSKRERTPKWVTYLGSALPHASMTLLLVYCIKDVGLRASPHGLPEALAFVLTGGLHLWRNNIFLSIAAGTLFYMFLVQRVFV